MFTIGGFLIAALLVLTRDQWLRLPRPVRRRSVQRLQPDSHHLRRGLVVDPGAGLEPLAGDRAVRVPGADAVLHRRHDDHGAASNLMTLYLGLELQSLALYVLAAFARDDLRSSEAGLKYFVLSGLSSGLLLYGISLVYGFSGTMDLASLHELLVKPESASPGLVVGIVFVLVGLAFKVSAVPFHMWTPDVYEGAPTPVTVFFATAPEGRGDGAAAAGDGDVVRLAGRRVAAPGGDRVDRLDAAGCVRRDRADQHQAADGIFLDRPYGLCADRPRGRHGRRRARHAGLHGHLRVHDRRHLRLHHGDAAEGASPVEQIADLSGSGGERSRRWRWRWRCSCSAWPAFR